MYSASNDRLTRRISRLGAGDVHLGGLVVDCVPVDRSPTPRRVTGSKQLGDESL